MSKSQELSVQWEQLVANEPHIRIRTAAQRLNVSEAELLSTTIGDNCIRLGGSWGSLIKELPKLGKVMSLTRNEGCVLEHKGTFQKIDVMGSGSHAMATVIGPIEQRIFFSAWHVGFAVKSTTKEGKPHYSLQFFDRAGTAILKIFLQEKSNFAYFEHLVATYKSDDQRRSQEVQPYSVPNYAKEVNTEVFLEAWRELKDTHDFFGLLRHHNLHRQHALQLAANKFTWLLDKGALWTALEKAAEVQMPIMIFAGNRGNIQIHQGKIRTLRVLERESEKWLNVLDPDFNMHLREDLIDQLWLVKKPTSDGIVTSLEAFDAAGELIVQMFGLRKPGFPELPAWQNLVATLPQVG